jgi:phosphate transport system protein
MVRTGFDRDLQTVQDQLLLMGSMVEKAIAKALDAFRRRDLQTSEQLVKEDALINQQRFQIEERCIELIATQQPAARDLRSLLVIMYVATELERMGDYAAGTARISLMMGEEPPLKPLIDIPRMTDKAVEMLRKSLDAFVNRDQVAARQVCNEDDEVDALYDQVYRELLVFMIQDPRTIQRATYLLWVAHNVERIADRATNIAERVIFLVTGKLTEINVSTY